MWFLFKQCILVELTCSRIVWMTSRITLSCSRADASDWKCIFRRRGCHISLLRTGVSGKLVEGSFLRLSNKSCLLLSFPTIFHLYFLPFNNVLDKNCRRLEEIDCNTDKRQQNAVNAPVIRLWKLWEPPGKNWSSSRTYFLVIARASDSK